MPVLLNQKSHQKRSVVSSVGLFVMIWGVCPFTEIVLVVMFGLKNRKTLQVIVK